MVRVRIMDLVPDQAWLVFLGTVKETRCLLSCCLMASITGAPRSSIQPVAFCWASKDGDGKESGLTGSDMLFLNYIPVSLSHQTTQAPVNPLPVVRFQEAVRVFCLAQTGD